MHDLKLKTLLSLAAALLVAISLAAGGYAWHKFDDIATAGAARTAAATAVTELKNARYHVVQIQQFLTDVGATHDPGGFDEASENLEAARGALARLVAVAPALAAQRDDVLDKLAAVHAVGVEMAQTYIDQGREAGNAIMKRPDTGLDDASAALATELDGFAARLEQDFNAAEAEATAAARAVRSSVLAALALIALAGFAIMATIYQRVLPPLRRLLAALEALRAGGATNTRLEGLRADFRDVARAFNAILDAQDARRMAEQEAAAESRRVVEALDNVHSQVTLVDERFAVLYLNRTLKRCFAQFAASARADWPEFDAEQLVGVDARRFGVEVARELADTGASAATTLSFAGRQFHVSASPVRGADGARLGTVLEWTDLTEQRAAEAQIEQMIGAAVAGEFGQRLTLASFDEGFLRRLAGGINQMLDSMVLPLRRAMDYVEQLSRGEIPPPVAEAWRGELASLKDNMNRCTAAIERLVQDAETLARAGVAGQLDTRADASGHAGAFREVVEGVNHTLDAIVRPITECRQVFTRMATGDLGGRMRGEYRGDFAVLRDALHDSLENLARTVLSIRGATESLKSASSEIATGNWDLSQRTETQGHAVERTTANVRELALTVRQNATHTAAAMELAASARDQADRGGQVVERAVAAMGEINHSSARITDIVGVIDDLAFQTNLLALNAAVEAARAGEQGRGFAVVASEVRNLAQRSAEAAREIKTLIGDSVQRVTEGVRLVNESGESLTGIVDAVKHFDELIAQIAAASRQQSAGIDEVANAIARIDEGTQQNAALVEQTAAASRMLSEQAIQVQTLVENLRTAEDGAAKALAA